MKYVDIPFIARKGCTWNTFVAARQIGKTYGIFKRFMDERIRFVYMRRTATELTRAVKLGLFDELNRKEGYEYCIDYSANDAFGYIYADSDKSIQIGVALSMSAAQSYRGINYSSYDELFFDEFMAADGSRKLKADATTCMNAFETIFGNRELPPNNLPPMKVWLAANAIDLEDDILSALNLTETVAYMKTNKIKTMNIPQRSLYMYCGTEKEVAEAKKQTSLYKFLGSDTEEAINILEGEFKGSDINLISAKEDMTKYRCVFSIDNKVFVYLHKDENTWYVCESPQQNIPNFVKTNIAPLKRKYGTRYALLRGYDMVKYQKPYMIKYMDLLLL